MCQLSSPRKRGPLNAARRPLTVISYLYFMNLKTCLILLVSIISNVNLVLAQLVKVEDFAPRRADTIILERNWRTRNRIILSELEFAVGDTVNPENLGLSLKKIWNLQNFVTVGYRWDSLPGGRSALILVARDAFTIYPVFGGRISTIYDATVKLGIADHNFLGRNIRLEMRGQISFAEPFFGEMKVTIPRQLLWKNMSLGAGVHSEMIDFDVYSNQVFATIGNPFHEDYRNTLSPDFETGLIRHKNIPPSSHELIENPNYWHDWLPYNRSFWYFRVTESVGTVTHRRHQEEGYNITGMIGGGIGLNAGTRSFVEGSILAEYHKLIRPRLQLSARWEGHYFSTEYKSLWTRYGPENIRGIEYGQLTGPLMQLASTGLYYTWLNWDYLAVEQSVFVQYASVMTSWGDLSGIKRHYAIGTGFHFTIPMYPAASLLITFSYNPNRYNWFYLEL